MAVGDGDGMGVQLGGHVGAWCCTFWLTSTSRSEPNSTTGCDKGLCMTHVVMVGEM